jgi:hypothetical protein
MNLIPTLAEQPLPSLRRTLLAHLFRVANANGNPWWYHIKGLLLDPYAVRDGYDVQRIEAVCHTCYGTGQHDHGECWDCNNGVHHVVRYILLRWSFEGLTFHRPGQKLVSDGHFESARAGAQNVFTSRLAHRDIDPATSQEARLWILVLTGIYKLHQPSCWHLAGAWHCGLHYLRPWHPLQILHAIVTAPKRWRERASALWQRRYRERLYRWAIRHLTERLYPRGTRGQCPQIAAEAAYHGDPTWKPLIEMLDLRRESDCPF